MLVDYVVDIDMACALASPIKIHVDNNLLLLPTTTWDFHGNFDGNGVAYIGHNIYSNLGPVRPLLPILLKNGLDKTDLTLSANPR